MKVLLKFSAVVLFGLSVFVPLDARAVEGALSLEEGDLVPREAPRDKVEAFITPRNEIEMQALLMEHEQALRDYERTGLAMRDEIREIIQADAERRIEYIRSMFDGQIEEKEDALDPLRKDAIRLFARFVRRYPNNKKHSPDAFFRLAELYFEAAEVDYFKAEEEYDVLDQLFTAGRIPDEPETPEKSYANVIRTLSALTKRFPDYRFDAAALYLLGYTLQESVDDDAARKAYLKVVARHPESDYAAESYMRLGELDFEVANFEDAAKYYGKVLDYPKSKYYDLAMYKLAWSLYQDFKYEDAIGIFKNLIAYYDDSKKRTGKVDARAGMLRSEAVEYVAKAFAEDDWDGDGSPDENKGTARAFTFIPGEKPYEREILKQYADVLFEYRDEAHFNQAILCYNRLIQQDPNDPANPDYQAKIVSIYDELLDFPGKTKARQDMARLFDRTSEWYARNKEDAEAVEKADMLVEVALYQRAVFLHMNAQEMKFDAKSADDPEKLLESISEYQKAAAAYLAYLDRYPKSAKNYEIRFNRAEAVYYSDDFDLAGKLYAEVRDDESKTEYREDAAFSAITCAEKVISKEVGDGKIPEKSSPSNDFEMEEVAMPDQDSSEIKRMVPEPMPPDVKYWVDALDRYAELDLQRPDDPEARPTFAYQAAEMSYRFKDFEKTRQRAADILDKYQSSEIAPSAAALIINTYKMENDWDNLQKWATIIEEKKVGAPEEQAELKAAIRMFRLGAQFRTAEKLLAEKQYLAAADEFARLAEETGVKFADKALYNAAMSYTEVKHYEKASRAFEKILTEPRFAQSQFMEMALFQVAENSKKFFDFSKSISSYLALYKRNPKNKDSPYSLFSAAKLLEEDGRLEEAAGYYALYSDKYKDREDAPFALYRASKCWAKLKNEKQEGRLLRAFIKRAKDNMEMGGMVLESMVRLGELAGDIHRGKRSKQLKYYREVISLYKQRAYKPGSYESKFAAGCEFKIVDLVFNKYKAVKIKGSMTAMGKLIAKSQKLMAEVEAGFANVTTYGSLDWTFAAFLRIGSAKQEFANKFYDAPEPPGLDEEELEVYQMEIEDYGTQWEDAAVEAFEEMVFQAKKRKVTNEWVKKALAILNKYKPEEYPLAKEEKESFVWEDAWSFAPGKISTEKERPEVPFTPAPPESSMEEEEEGDDEYEDGEGEYEEEGEEYEEGGEEMEESGEEMEESGEEMEESGEEMEESGEEMEESGEELQGEEELEGGVEEAGDVSDEAVVEDDPGDAEAEEDSGEGDEGSVVEEEAIEEAPVEEESVEEESVEDESGDDDSTGDDSEDDWDEESGDEDWDEDGGDE